MKKLLVAFLTLTLLISCDDGNLEVPSFEFETTVNHCGEHVIYKLSSSSTEALILTLDAAAIQNTVTTTPIEIPITSSNVSYRVFESAIIPNTYFCAAVPPTTPNVTRNWEAISGAQNIIIIETSEVLDTTNTLISFKHTLTLKNLVLESNGETITYQTYSFGSFETAL